jgi:hypothetical protein
MVAGTMSKDCTTDEKGDWNRRNGRWIAAKSKKVALLED